MLIDGWARNNLLRIAAAVPLNGLAFSDADMLHDKMRPHWHRTRTRHGLHVCVKNHMLRFSAGKYIKPKIYELPLPPLKLFYETPRLWPEFENGANS
jgi:hypothetical protein